MSQPAQAELRPDYTSCVVGASANMWRLCWASALAVASMVAVSDLVMAQTRPTSAPIEFNIPSQSLNTALSRYGDATGREALFDASLAVGRVSGDVRGTFSPDEALSKLLSGTGLAAEFVEETTFVLLPGSTANQHASQSTRSPDQRRYYGLIQASLLNTLCRSRGVRPGRYRFAAVFWIAPDGAVQKTQRLGSTGAYDSDQKIDVALRSVRVSESPPAGFVSPVLMLIVPQESQMTACDNIDPTLGPGGIGR